MEKIITAKRYSELAAQKLQSSDLSLEGEEILDRITKGAENGHESQIYLAKRKMTELEKNYDSEVLQIIDVLEYLLRRLHSSKTTANET